MIMFELCSSGSAMGGAESREKANAERDYSNIPIRPIVIKSGEEVVAPFSKVGESEQG
jgi:hypothetical protein